MQYPSLLGMLSKDQRPTCMAEISGWPNSVYPWQTLLAHGHRILELNSLAKGLMTIPSNPSHMTTAGTLSKPDCLELSGSIQVASSKVLLEWDTQPNLQSLDP